MDECSFVLCIRAGTYRPKWQIGNYDLIGSVERKVCESNEETGRSFKRDAK